MDNLQEKLQEFFAPDEIEFRIGAKTKDNTKGLALAYVTNRAIQNRLDEVFGPFNWKNEFRQWKDRAQICGISVWDEDKGHWITKWDGADDSDVESTKGGLSDAMKRAAYHWGIGRYLYRMPSVWAKIKPQGKSYVLDEVPKIPDEFLPERYRGKGGGTSPKNGLLGQLMELVDELEYPREKITQIINDKYKKENSSKLTQKELGELIEYFASLKAVKTKQYEVKCTDETLLGHLQSQYGKESINQLTKAEAAEVIKFLEEV